jgi:transcriptional regulator with XRE-family HTH domain
MVRTFRIRPADVGQDRAGELARRFGAELRLARMSAGLTQKQVAVRSGVSQQIISQAERGDAGLSLIARCRMTAAVGHELGLRLFPVDGVALRDSGQLAMAQAIVSVLHGSWSARFEAPVAAGDRRAADVLLTRTDEIVEIEIERTLVDLQGQLRAGQLKRRSIAEQSNVPVRLIMAVPDSARIRAKVAPFEDVIARALPVASREIASALRNGRAIGGDGLLFVRAGRLTGPTGTREPIAAQRL